MGHINLFKEHSCIEPAAEPTNIIWEHRDFTAGDRAVRFVINVIGVSIALICAFAITILIKQNFAVLTAKYDVSVNCKTLNKQYDEDTLSKLASNEWEEFYDAAEGTQGDQLSAVFNCFCQG